MDLANGLSFAWDVLATAFRWGWPLILFGLVSGFVAGVRPRRAGR